MINTIPNGPNQKPNDMAEIFSEITPLTQYDCFLVFERFKKDFDFPIHTHDELELNFIFNGAGVLRVVGDHKEEIGDLELVLVGSKLPHCWMTHNYEYKQEKGEMFEITIQFHKDLLDEKLLRRNQVVFIKSLLAFSVFKSFHKVPSSTTVT